MATNRLRTWTFILSAFVALGVACAKRESPSAVTSNAAPTKTIRIAGTPHQDTTQYLWGIAHDAFKRRGIRLEIRDTTWNDQIEMVAGGGCDIAMATVDEIAAKSKNLDLANRRVVYVMPAWLFEGQIFVARPEIKSLAELKTHFNNAEAHRRFFEQLRGKKIAVPEGSSYDQALRKLMTAFGYDPASFAFVNSELEAGINGLSDSNVAIAAAGIVERPESERRGYKIALDSLDLEMVVIAGFVCNATFYDRNPNLIDEFLFGWFDSVTGGLSHPQEHYALFAKYLSQRGAKVPSFAEYESALRYTRFARTPSEVRDTFLEPTSRSYWRKAWDARVQIMRDSGQADQVPTSFADFIADATAARLLRAHH
jgi:ABC-type nitrate/sulfonate/bicarbonate transport system substrate-binding protein